MHHSSPRRNNLTVFLLVLLAAIAWTGCNALTSILISNQEEVELGKAVAGKVTTQYKIVAENDPIDDWADALVQAMVPASAQFRDPAEFGGYKVHVIANNELINAFATPGGFVYIGSGLILNTQSCAELAGVVGHEIGHVVDRDSVKQIARSSAILGLSDVILKKNISEQVLAGVYKIVVSPQFSKKDESQADEKGTVIMHDTGYNPYALAHMFAHLAELQKGNRPIEFFSSHPLSTHRAEAIRTQIKETWPQVKESNDPNFTYDCIGTTMAYADVQQRLANGQVALIPGSGEGVPEQAQNPAQNNSTPQKDGAQK